MTTISNIITDIAYEYDVLYSDNTLAEWKNNNNNNNRFQTKLRPVNMHKIFAVYLSLAI